MLRTWAPRVTSPWPAPSPGLPCSKRGPSTPARSRLAPPPGARLLWGTPTSGTAGHRPARWPLRLHPRLAPLLLHRPHDRVWTLKVPTAPRSAVTHDYPGTLRPPRSCLPSAPASAALGAGLGQGAGLLFSARRMKDGGAGVQVGGREKPGGQGGGSEGPGGRGEPGIGHRLKLGEEGAGGTGRREAEGASDHSLPAD